MPSTSLLGRVKARLRPFKILIYWLLLFLGVFAGSTAVILIKASSEHPLLVASYRLLIAAVVLSPLFFRSLKQRRQPYTWREFSWTILPGLVLALHFVTWVIGARLTRVSNASLVINLAPVAMPFFLWLFYREVVNRAEITGTLLSIAGLAVLIGANFQLSTESLQGDLITFGSMLAFAAYLALGRANRARLGLWLYLVPLYAIAGITCLIAALFFINPVKAYTLPNLLAILGLGIIPTVIGHTLLNYSMKHFRGQVVSVANLGQIIFGSIMGIIFFSEYPSGAFYIAAALIFAGVVVVVLSNQKKN